MLDLDSFTSRAVICIAFIKQCRIQIVILINHPNIDNHCIRNTLEFFRALCYDIYVVYQTEEGTVN